MKKLENRKTVNERRKEIKERCMSLCSELKSKGLTNKEISEELGVSEGLVRWYLLKERRAAV